jgi:DNA-binding NarL/FixJ family response regulator
VAWAGSGQLLQPGAGQPVSGGDVGGIGLYQLDQSGAGDLRGARLVGSETDALGALTAREREVLSLMAEGLTNNAIARRLVLTERTVEGHIRSVLMKLDLPASEDAHRRMLAVITYLRAAESQH